MKKTMKFLSMTALALVGAVMTVGCSSDDDINDATQQPEAVKGNTITLTTTVSLDNSDATTRALTGTGEKTFAKGEKMALVYQNKNGETVKVESAELEDDDIESGAQSATFTFELTDPKKEGNVTYIYPAAMAKNDGSVNYDALNSQDGTLNTLSSNLDLATSTAAWDGNNLPQATLANQLAILAITLKNEAGTSDLTDATTKLTLSDGTNTYNVSPSSLSTIYVAIQPTNSATISIEATDGVNGYCKTLTTKTYEASNGYPVSWKMTPDTLLSTISSNYTAQDGETLYGKLGSNVKISIAGGASVTLKDVTINGENDGNCQWAGITCAGDAIITLEGANAVKGFCNGYPGIYVPEGNTLIIEGEGSLNASCNDRATGIGGGRDMHCGNITIKGGNITATGGEFNAGIGGGDSYDDTGIRCGKITINGGTVTAMGGEHAAGIGSGDNEGSCNDITINGGTVTATGGTNAAGIGSGDSGSSCGAITISGGTVTATGGECGAGIGSGDSGIFGAITISGGTVTATGGDYAAGIGGGHWNSTCGTITITSTVTKVTAIKGEDAPNSIGAGDGGEEITVDNQAGAKVTEE